MEKPFENCNTVTSVIVNFQYLKKNENFLRKIRRPQWKCCTFVLAIEREAVSLTEKRRFAMSERPYHSKTDRVMTKGAKVGALSEKTNL
jgi:hypothetical protein